MHMDLRSLYKYLFLNKPGERGLLIQASLLWKWRCLNIFEGEFKYVMWIRRARMMAACDMVLITLKEGTEGEGQLVCVTSPVLGRIILISGDPRGSWRGWTSLHTGVLCCIIPMPRRENGVLNLVSSAETFFVRKLHVHNIIIVQAWYDCYVMWI